MEMSPWFVLLLGMGTVFVGLFAIILLTKLMSTLMGTKATASEPASKRRPQKPRRLPFPNKLGFLLATVLVLMRLLRRHLPHTWERKHAAYASTA